MTVPRPLISADSPLSVAVPAVAERIAALLRSPEDMAVPIPGAQWTVGEAAAHLMLANALMADLAAGRERSYGDGTPGGLAAANTASLNAFTERDPAILAAGIVRHARAFTDTAPSMEPGAQLATPMGPMDLGHLGAYLLAHMLGHGYDIAVALRRPHMISPQRALLTVPFLITAMPRVVEPRATAGHTACYDLRLRGGPRFTATFTDGALAVTDAPPRRPDCTIVTEPVTFLLIALGRRTTTSALARGAILAWGRRPWLAPRFPTLFTAP
ncbi:maleylpyruvate isomerase family mycothiol-dependent enzyme [Streptomyces sp. CBMA29]|uniref:maleylpyruvate isomerase family mycothiol-dependent enzyme n=1 Tax=Streptomyces sp. CBMA29 TaxID=1896314 RepID=UPI0016618EAA|nr:maleylpyruvate isomerase family mycothiol-dependent enzyme [Streptomyces sp. CBMA29]MBD0739310.1 sterol-binding protein [Streptomyces sp. CBMA29]